MCDLHTQICVVYPYPQNFYYLCTANLNKNAGAS